MPRLTTSEKYDNGVKGWYFRFNDDYSKTCNKVSSESKWVNWITTNRYIVKKIKRIAYIVDPLSADYTIQARIDYVRSFSACVQHLWLILYDDNGWE